MITYTDAKVIAALKVWLKASGHSYREAANVLGVDYAQLNKIVNAKVPVSVSVARSMGFLPVIEPKRWVRWQDTERK